MVTNQLASTSKTNKQLVHRRMQLQNMLGVRKESKLKLASKQIKKLVQHRVDLQIVRTYTPSTRSETELQSLTSYCSHFQSAIFHMVFEILICNKFMNFTYFFTICFKSQKISTRSTPIVNFASHNNKICPKNPDQTHPHRDCRGCSVKHQQCQQITAELSYILSHFRPIFVLQNYSLLSSSSFQAYTSFLSPDKSSCHFD